MNPRIASFLTLCLLLFSSLAYAQNDQGFHYQAVARDAGGALLTGTSVNLRFQIRAGSPNGTLVYQEKQTPVTNSFGLLNTTIGKGTLELGDFTTIDWQGQPHYLVVELNGASLDTTLFEAVPYAKVATAMDLRDLQDVSESAPVSDDVLRWDGSSWTPGQALTLTGSGATTVSGTYPNLTISSTDAVNDADASTTNELQSLSLSGNTLSLSLGGGSVSLASFSSPWNNSGSNLYFNTGKIGIGDNSPVATLTVGNGDKFQVHGSDGDVVFKDDQGSIRFANSNGSNAAMMYMFSSGTNNSTRMVTAHSPNFSSWGVQYNDTADAFTWIGDNEPIFRVALSGNQAVSVGTRSPQSRFHIEHESNLSSAQLQVTETQYDYSRIRFNNTVHPGFWDVAGRVDTNLANAKFNIYNSATGDIFTVRGDGRVGINDASPAYALEINGNQRTRVLNIYNTAPTTTGTSYNYGLRSSLGISSNTGFPRLYSVYGIISDSDAYLSYGVYGSASNASQGSYGVYGRTTTSAHYAGYFTGDVYTTGVYQTSDARFKENITPIQTGLEKVMALKPMRYEYDLKQYDFMTLPAGEQYGFLAQDVAQSIPSLTKDTFQPYEEARDDTPEGQGMRFTAVNYIGFIPLMVSAMQEQQQTIEKQAEKIADLESRLARLEALLDK
ncbi:MAG: tail fiber domain-containing protein [Bacteroidota bacterium]